MRLTFTIILLFGLLSNSIGQRMGIGTSNPDASSVLEITDTAKGLLIPRMNKVQRLSINSPAEGLMVYQTDDKKGIWRYSGALWKNDNPPSGTNNGDLLYWNGTDWSVVPAGDYGKPLGLCNSTPTWGGCLASITTMIFDITRLDGTVDVGYEMAVTGGTPIIRSGVCWSQTPNPTIDSSNSTSDGPGLGNYTTTINNLSGNTIYHVRAYATNSAGTAYGQDVSFRTKMSFGGQYTSNGYFYHPTASRVITNRPKTLQALSENSVVAELGDLGTSGYYAIFTVDTSTNIVTISTNPGSVNIIDLGSGLPTTNPGYTPQWSGSANCNNVYDPVNKEFRVRYGYLGGAANNTFRVTEEIIRLNP